MIGAIVGFGEVASRGHWPGYATRGDVSIAAVVDQRADRRAAAAAAIPGVRTFESMSELAAAMDVEFVDICTPPAHHAAPVLAALDRGWHVLCEKPFVLDPIALEEIRERAAAESTAVVPVHNWKYAPIIRRATEWIDGGAIGDVLEVTIEVSRLRAAATVDAALNWRRDPAIAGGGIVMDHGWHAVYLALHWFKAPAIDVSGVLHRTPGSAVEDQANIAIAFPNGTASIALTWNGDARHNRIHLSGTRGDIRIDDGTLRLDANGHPGMSEAFAPLSAGSHHDDWFATMLPDVLAAFERPALSRPMLDEAAACLSIITRAYRSGMM